MRYKLFYVVASVVQLTSAREVFAAGCAYPNDVCKHIQFCLDKSTSDNTTFRERILLGVRQPSGEAIWDGTEQCQKRFGQSDGDSTSWTNASNSCSNQEFIDQGLKAAAHSCDPRVHWLCVRNGDNQFLGTIGSDCSGSYADGTSCSCPTGGGHVLRQVDP
jgi:hypothetical protein